MDPIIKDILTVLDKHGYITDGDDAGLIEEHLEDMLDTLDAEGYGPDLPDELLGDREDD